MLHISNIEVLQACLLLQAKQELFYSDHNTECTSTVM